VAFKQRDYAESQKEFEALLGAISGSKKADQREQLIRYQIYLSLLLQGHESAAQKALDDFKMMDETPALYYAQAAWAFQHGNAKQADNWIANAQNLFSPESNRPFAAGLRDVGWLGSAPTSQVTQLAQKEPSGGPTPAGAEINENTSAAAASEKTNATAEAENPREKRVASSQEPKTKKPAKSHSRRRKSEGTVANHADASSSKRRKSAPSPTPVPSSTPLVTSTPYRENLGDKVRNLVLSAMRRRPATTASPTPSPSVPPAGPKTRTPSPSPAPRRN
jgi:hypothetical protein